MPRLISTELHWLADALRKVPSLTRREAEIVVLLGLGTDSTREIAGSLGISEYTVKRHMTHIIEKLGVRSRVHVALLGFSVAALWHEGGIAVWTAKDQSFSRGRTQAANIPGLSSTGHRR